MRSLNIDGEKYSELEVRQKREEWLMSFRENNASEEVEKALGKDTAFEKYKKELEEFLVLAACDDLQGYPIPDRLELAKLRREDGHGPWSDKS